MHVIYMTCIVNGDSFVKLHACSVLGYVPAHYGEELYNSLAASGYWAASGRYCIMSAPAVTDTQARPFWHGKIACI